MSAIIIIIELSLELFDWVTFAYFVTSVHLVTFYLLLALASYSSCSCVSLAPAGSLELSIASRKLSSAFIDDMEPQLGQW